ncbi:MAG: N-acetylglucosamine-6-phosphate deacetylase [Candidatus Epulonipiscium fishelsonii]|nr:MAG: N-acetylglucosamine-6-phosphate deacetylase [Epulopiscium sp. AS2M-Bin002]
MIIQSEKVWIAGQFIQAQIEIKEKKIKSIYPYGFKVADKDYGSNKILPGFIDIHCHGAYGFDTNDATEEGLRNWTKKIVEEGVTSFLPTTITQSKEVLTKALKNVAKVVDNGYEGANILGIHFEGPYLDLKYKGAQPDKYIVKPIIEQFKEYQKAANGLIKYITLAPEHDENFELTKYCVQNNIIVSAGHSSATYNQILLAFANGVTSMTHVYNGMTPFNHRQNGLVGAAFRFKNMYGEIICDGNHSTLAALHEYFMAKGSDYAIMVTDALLAKGLPIGSIFKFGGRDAKICEDGSAYLLETENLAGSTLKMNKSLKLLIEDALVPVENAINACTKNPATCLGIQDKKGNLKVGCDADIIVLNKDYEVIQTYCLGIAMYNF